MGPVFIHQESDFDTFYEFFSYLAGQLSKYKATLKGMEVTYDEFFFGTDEELALCSALETAFPRSPIVFCTRHIQRNVKYHLQKKANRTNVNKVMSALWYGRNCLMSATQKDFEKKREAFIKEYQDYFSSTYLKRLMERLEKNVLNPSLLTHSITTTWTNNDGM